MQDWVGGVLGRHKIPVHIFWLGDTGVPEILPTTGSGKIKKNELRALGNHLIAPKGTLAKTALSLDEPLCCR